MYVLGWDYPYATLHYDYPYTRPVPSGFGGTAGSAVSRVCICPQGLLAAVTLVCDEAGGEGVRARARHELSLSILSDHRHPVGSGVRV